MGYGGTQEEMKRLISDANDYAASIGEASDLSIDSFSDIITAIDLIQQKQHIAGTTAREAATTIEGSLSMAKAAWENWLTGLGDSDADMSQLTDNLVTSVETAAENVVPRVAEILGTLIGTVPGMVAEIGPTLVSAAGQIGDTAIEALRASFEGNDFALGLVDGLDSALDEIEQRFNGFKSLWSMGDNPVESFTLVAKNALNMLNGDIEALTGNSHFARRDNGRVADGGRLRREGGGRNRAVPRKFRRNSGHGGCRDRHRHGGGIHRAPGRPGGRIPHASAGSGWRGLVGLLPGRCGRAGVA